MDLEFRCRFPKLTRLSSFRYHLLVIPSKPWQTQKLSNTSLAKMWLHLHVRHFHLQAVKGFMFIFFNMLIFDFPFRHLRHASSGGGIAKSHPCLYASPNGPLLIYTDFSPAVSHASHLFVQMLIAIITLMRHVTVWQNRDGCFGS